MRSPSLAFLVALLFLAPLSAQESPAATAEEPTAAASSEAEAAPAEEVPVEAAPAEEALTEAAPAEAAPAEAAPAEAAPAEEAPVEAVPAEEALTEAAPAETAPAETAPAETAPAEAAPADAAALQAEIDRLGVELEEANTVIDELRSEAWTLKSKAEAAEALAKAERASAEAAETAARAADAARADAARDAQAVEKSAAQAQEAAAAHEREAAALEEEAARLKGTIAALEARIAELEAKRESKAEALSSWGGLRIDPASYPQILRSGFAGAARRMGSWKIADGVAAQTDASQYFSRLTFPLVQSSKPTLYSFDVKAGAKGWVGAGLHFFAEGVRRPKGYGEGRSLLVWLTRDAKARGDRETYLQIYRSDDDVNMERVLDAEIREGVAAWNRVDVLYEPGAEFVVIAVNGTVRAAYRTFFGIGTGVSVSLRTLGAGVAFRNFEIRR